MSSTDSCVVKAPRAGPICSAHSSTSGPSVLSVAFSSAARLLKTGQFSGAECPVPRWSNTSRSRVRQRRRDRRARAVRRAGRAACPGPPASATTALWPDAALAALRSTVSAIVPGALPLRSSGTVRRRAGESAALAHGANGSAAPAADAPTPAEQADRQRCSEHRDQRSPWHPANVSVTRGRETPHAGRAPRRARLRRTMPSEREIVDAAGRARRGRTVQPRGARGGLLFCSGSDPAGPAQRRAGRRHARRAGAPLPGEPARGLRRRRSLAGSAPCA